VVAPDIGCIGAVLDERGGVPYEPAEDQPLRAMRELVDADTAGMGAHNRRVAESLDWGTVARRTLAVYRGELP
jgi:glycosyltransferase involved in cell wall biosynthesis